MYFWARHIQKFFILFYYCFWSSENPRVPPNKQQQPWALYFGHRFEALGVTFDWWHWHLCMYLSDHSRTLMRIFELQVLHWDQIMGSSFWKLIAMTPYQKKLQSQTEIWPAQVGTNNPQSPLLNVPQILKTRVRVTFWKISDWPMWISIDPLSKTN